MLSPRQWIVLFALVVFAFARLSGAHLHLCFDGSEPALALHTTNGTHLDHHLGAEHHPESEQSHDDVDVNPLSDVLAKDAKVTLPFLAALITLFLLLPTPISHRIAIARASMRPHRPPRFALPPLRGPPV